MKGEAVESKQIETVPAATVDSETSWHAPTIDTISPEEFEEGQG